MDAEREQRILALARRSLDVPEGERAAFLLASCPDDEDLIEEVLGVLQHDVDEGTAGAGASVGPSTELQELVGRCLRALEAGDDTILERICSEHSGLAQAIRSEVARCRDRGATPPGAGEDPPDSIGGYRILGQLGAGGMGVVYRAEQQTPVRRLVALKVVRLDPGRRDVLARFEVERRALAAMSHSCIARMLDAGTTPEGQPYFVMELIDGQPITTWCEESLLPLRQRIVLFQKVCAAVQHAHQKGVMHRDIKPANILVIWEGDVATPKLVDFGLAKATDHELFAHAALTEEAVIVGTPEYMAPEQATLDSDAIDARVDIYSLGVLLYELLTGRQPFPSTELRKGGWAEVVRRLTEDEPQKPSTRAMSSGGRPGTSPRSLARVLRGDLDWIVLKAMAKDPERRYQSAAGLAEDLERYLHHDPVLAGPPSTGYRVKKFVRKYRTQVAAAALVVLSLVGGIIGTSVGFARARDSANLANERAGMLDLALRDAQSARAAEETQRHKAEEEAARARAAEARAERSAEEARQIVAFQSARLADIDPRRMGADLWRDLVDQARLGMEDDGLTATEIDDRLSRLSELLAGVNTTDVALHALKGNIFERTIAAIDEQFGEQPLVAAQLLQTTASTLRELGLLSDAAGPQDRALTLRRAHLGDLHVDTLRSISERGLLLHQRGELDAAEAHSREALDGSRDLLGEDAELTVSFKSNLAVLLRQRGDLRRAEALLLEVLEVRKRLGDDAIDPMLISNLSAVLFDQGRLTDAERLCREALGWHRATLGEDHPTTLVSAHNLGEMLTQCGRPAEAEPLLRETLERRRRVLGGDHPRTLDSMNSLVRVLHYLGRLREAEPIMRATLEGQQRVLGENHPDTLTSINNMGFIVQGQGRLAEAEPFFVQALEGRRRVLGVEHPLTLQSINNMGFLRQQQGRFADAVPFLRDALEAQRRVLGDEHPDTLTSAANLSLSLQRMGRLDEAEPYLLFALEGRRRVLGDDHALTLQALNNLGTLRSDQGRLEEAVACFREAFEGRRRVLGEDHPDTLASINSLGVLAVLTDPEEAARLLSQSLAGHRRARGDDHYETLNTLINYTGLLRNLSRWSEAEPLAREALERSRRVLGGSHSMTGRAQGLLGTVLLGMGDEALEQQSFGSAEGRYLEAHEVLAERSANRHGSEQVSASIERIIALYDAWHANDPDAGHDASAASWRDRLIRSE